MIHYYNALVTPGSYSRWVTCEEYIPQAEDIIFQQLEKASLAGPMEALAIGLPSLDMLQRTEGLHSLQHHVIEHNSLLVSNAQRQLPGVQIIKASAERYCHPIRVEMMYAIRMHHTLHRRSAGYLAHLYAQLQPNGTYMAAEMFIPDYTTIHEQLCRHIVWRSHIIGCCLDCEETQRAKTEAGHLWQAVSGADIMSDSPGEALEIILKQATEINHAILVRQTQAMEWLAEQLLKDLNMLMVQMQIEPSDHLLHRQAISRAKFEHDAREAGFTLEAFHSMGPVNEIGGMGLYVMRK